MTRNTEDATGADADGDDRDWESVPHEGERWQLDMRRARSTTDEERRKDDRMFREKFVRFTARVEAVDTVLGGPSPVEMTVTRANGHRNAPAVGATVMKHTDIMSDFPEWERVGGN